MAFQLKISRPTGADDADTEAGADGAAKGGGGKKKAKKGKKVSLSALGFNVVSNRIMMGEIQNVDDWGGESAGESAGDECIYIIFCLPFL